MKDNNKRLMNLKQLYTKAFLPTGVILFSIICVMPEKNLTVTIKAC